MIAIINDVEIEPFFSGYVVNKEDTHGIFSGQS